jgi:flagellar motility protein MotE (MotC chaperone)
MKVLISFFYLQSGPVGISTANLALAESKTEAVFAAKDETAEDQGSDQALKKLESELRAKEQDLNKREEELAPLKEEIEGRLAELTELQTRLTAYAKRLGEREQALNAAKNEHLVALYSAMEPTRAAAIMDKLKLPTVVSILRSMKGKNAGQIMAMMNPERGAVISEKLNQLD